MLYDYLNEVQLNTNIQELISTAVWNDIHESFYNIIFLNDFDYFDRYSEYFDLYEELNNYINLTNSIDLLNTLNSTTNTINVDRNPLSLYTFSVPNMKIFYPEPFIATGNFCHTDLWFIHISIYQYWLWFFFIYLIIFFTIMFLVTLRWCNLRNKPQRETRGVSRSKCGDLITASIPVTWAGSIIVHESTDAVDFYDGFGTSEMAVGVRAYQWGWEYYYPKDIDILYLTSNFNNEFVGKSLYYTQENEEYGRTASFIEHHKIKNNLDASITPAHLICFSTGFNDVLNLASSKNFGYSKLLQANTFKHVMSSRYINYNLNLNYLSKNNLFYKKQGLLSFFNIDTNVVAKPKLHPKQHEYLSLSDLYKLHSSFYDLKPLYKYLELNKQVKDTKQWPSNKILNKTINILNHCYYTDQEGNVIYGIPHAADIIKTINSEIDYIKRYGMDHLLDTWLPYIKYEAIANYMHCCASFEENMRKHNIKIDDDFVDSFYKIRNPSLNDFKIMTTSVINKITNLDLMYTHKYNILNLPLTTDLTNLSSKISINTFCKFNNYNDTYTSLLNFNANLYYLNWLNSTTTVHSWVKTPFKPAYLNLLWLNSFNQELPILKQMDGWNNDFYFADFINKFFKQSFTNVKFNAQLDNIKLLSTFNIFIPNQYADLEAKRNPTFETFEDLVFNDYALYNFNDNNDTEYSLEYLTSQISFDDYIENIIMNEFNYQPIQFIKHYEKEYAEFTDKFDEKGCESIEDFELNTLDTYLKQKTLNMDNDNIKLAFSKVKDLNWNNVLLSNINNIDLNFITSINTQYLINYDYLNKMITSSFNNHKELQLLFNKFNTNVYNLFNIFKFINDPYTLLTSFWNNNENNNFTSTMSKFNLKHNADYFKNTFNYSILDSIKAMNQLELAIWRFYRHTFDTNKSFIHFDNFSSSYSKLPYINTYTNNFKKYINKNYLSFIKSNLYVPKLNIFTNTNHYLFNSTMMFMYNFPFSLANESDVLKYMWFDWYSNYNRRIAKQLDTNDYITNGVKVYKHKYDFSSIDVTKYNIKDNYLSRLSHSRKNYQPVWNYTPFILNTFKNWTKDYNVFMNLLVLNNTNSSDFKITTENIEFWIIFMQWFDDLYINLHNYTLSLTTLTNSGILTPSRNFWRPVNTLSSYTYFISSLADILTKREYLFKQLTNYYNLNINNFKTYNVSPYNTIFLNWKSNLLEYTNIESNIIENKKICEDVLKLNLLTRDLIYVYSKYLYLINNYYFLTQNTYDWSTIKFIINSLSSINNSLFAQQTLLNNKLITLNNFIFSKNVLLNISSVITNNYLLNTDKIFFKKTQYKHMRKSMANMIRIQNDKAVAMPVDTRIQFLTVSKDIIHSWAIPSAGIKIDCIPGYSSHKVTVFFLSGIYWGQCMEICGRYHHWMPIVVYFMKRDLFLLWCMHFVSVNKTPNNTTSAQVVNNNTDTNYVVSYPLSSWKNELN